MDSNSKCEGTTDIFRHKTISEVISANKCKSDNKYSSILVTRAENRHLSRWNRVKWS